MKLIKKKNKRYPPSSYLLCNLNGNSADTPSLKKRERERETCFFCSEIAQILTSAHQDMKSFLVKGGRQCFKNTCSWQKWWTAQSDCLFHRVKDAVEENTLYGLKPVHFNFNFNNCFYPNMFIILWFSHLNCTSSSIICTVNSLYLNILSALANMKFLSSNF